jgi:rhamnosyltransferase
MTPTVAIIMRAFNEMPHVQRALSMLECQTFRAFDLYAVDSGSSDGTLQALQAACGEAGVQQIAPADYMPGKVLNEAIARTHHEIILLLNADAIPLSNDWLERLIGPILDGHADATFSRQVARDDARVIVAYDYQRAYNPAKVAPGFYSAVACAFRRDLWETRTFREHGYAEDTIWAREGIKEGLRILLAADSVVEHSHNYTLKELFAKKRRQARALAECHFLDPRPGAEIYVCFRELIRDFCYALFRLKLGTIPYNIAYRVAVHAGTHKGLREGRP